MTQPIKLALKSSLKIYKQFVSPVLGPRCRFFPSCSEYASECLEKYPLHVAVSKTSGRMMRCHPWNPGGVDLP
jgi:hypothetical protein